MRVMMWVMVMVLSAIGMIALSADEMREFKPVFHEDIRIEGMGTPASVKTDQNHDLYILSSKTQNLLIYDRSQGKVRSIGRKDSTAMKFHYASEMALSKDEVAVIDESKQIIRFDRNGQFRNKLPIDFKDHPKPILYGCELSFELDSMIVVTGCPFEAFEGKLVHLFTPGWEYIRSIYDMSPVCKQNQIYGHGGYYLEILPNSHLLLMQPDEYVITEMTPAGDTVRQVNVKSDHYRPVGSASDDSSNQDSKEKKITGSDWIGRFYLVDDSTVMVSVNKAEGSDYLTYLDFVSLKTGRVLDTFKMNDDLIHYDPRTRELFSHVANHLGKVDPDELSRRSSSISVYDLKTE